MNPLFRTIIAPLALLYGGSVAAADSETIAPAAIQADLRLAVETIERRHPELSFSVDHVRLKRAAKDLARQIDRPMTRAEAWATLAQLNPVLADGHLFIGFPDWRGETVEAVKRGATFFPFEVATDTRGNARIVSALGGARTPLAGARIARINGRDAREIARTLLARTHGDTPAFRAALLSQRWWLFYSKIYGNPSTYDLVLEGAPQRRYRVPASGSLPDVLARDASFERLFGCELQPNGGAVLRVAAFDWEDKQRYFRFTQDCFARIKAARAKRLVIDVSENGGGNDDMWKDGVLRYIADRPYRHASRYIKRERTGEVTRGTLDSETAPALNEPLRFQGDVIVLVGPLTYSSAILFSNVAQDYGFATLAGTGGAARTRQSGGVQTIPLPNTGLILAFPRFVLDRPSGVGQPSLLRPDLSVDLDPLQPNAAIAALLSM